MPRDYAKTSSRKKKSGQLPGWVWMLGGLAIGLFVAFVVYLNNATRPGQKNSIATVVQDVYSDLQKNAEKRESRPARETNTKADKPKSKPKKPEPTATKFDFYYILPEIEVPVPDQELERKRKNPIQTEDADYILQVGSFRELAQADQLKAKLALNGLSASIQTVKINNLSWHRVRIGPINNINKLSETRRRLKENGIDSIVVKNKT